MAGFEELLRLAEMTSDGASRLFIQPHDFPDPDAVASAFALKHLFSCRGVKTTIVYEGDLQRSALLAMIAKLGIRIVRAAEAVISPADRVIIVDGCKGTKNVSDLPAREIAVLDHHLVKAPEDVPYTDIRPELGSCSTLLENYWTESGERIPPDVATALVIGISVDTAILTRGATEEDIGAYYRLSRVANLALAQEILRRNLEKGDLEFYRFALEHADIGGDLAFCHFPQGCDQNLLGILADFFIAVREVHFVVLSAANPGGINLSVRSDRPEWNAALLLKDLLDGDGFGGGHDDMAGGIIPDSSRYHPKEFRERLEAKLAQSTGTSLS
jgi:nanoRNase/pAp phosphatase (c-di-AMP/oligoRNAs hydrolase)